MEIEKNLEELGIEPIKPLDFMETSQIVTKWINSLLITFPFEEMDGCQLAEKMYKCKMYWAKFDKKLGNANYVYKNQSLYIRDEILAVEEDTFIWHECIHYMQDNRDDKGNLFQMGLCEFSKFKAYGVGMNEAATQYIAAKMLHYPHEKVNYCGIPCKTISKNYYPIMSNLIEQLENAVGEKLLVNSTLFGNEKCVTHLMEVMGETITRQIQEEFDRILENKAGVAEGNVQAQEIVKQSYIKIQNTLLEKYFEGATQLAKTAPELEEYIKRLEKHREIIGNVDNYIFYENFRIKQMKKMQKKLIGLKKKKNLPVLFKKNKLIAILMSVRNLFVRKQQEYDEK